MIELCMWLFLPLPAVFSIVMSSGTSDAHIYAVAKNVTLSSEAIDTAYSIINDIMVPSHCNAMCSMDDDCQSVIYDSQSHHCLMYSESQWCTLVTGSTDSTALIYSELYESRDQLESCLPQAYKDCQEAFEAGDVRSGEVYNLKPETSPKVFHAVCEFDSASGWTVILKRLDGSIDFYRNFADYTDGFGDLDGEYWIGLENIYHLTRRNRKIYFHLEDHVGYTAHANYSTFYLDGADVDYRLHIDGYAGTAGNSMSTHDNMRFSTYDHDSSNNCATAYKGAWWYNTCHHAQMTGNWAYNGNTGEFATGIVWSTWRGINYSLKDVTMKITV